MGGMTQRVLSLIRRMWAMSPATRRELLPPEASSPSMDPPCLCHHNHGGVVVGAGPSLLLPSDSSDLEGERISLSPVLVPRDSFRPCLSSRA
ncbi:hypothetical protein FKM82_010952 [Ascaphus truei]